MPLVLTIKYIRLGTNHGTEFRLPFFEISNRHINIKEIEEVMSKSVML